MLTIYKQSWKFKINKWLWNLGLESFIWSNGCMPAHSLHKLTEGFALHNFNFFFSPHFTKQTHLPLCNHHSVKRRFFDNLLFIFVMTIKCASLKKLDAHVAGKANNGKELPALFVYRSWIVNRLDINEIEPNGYSHVGIACM